MILCPVIVGSFELFTSQIALQTNDSTRLLSFIAVVIGAGGDRRRAGMNFDAPSFQTKAAGFWTAAGAMALLASGSITLARYCRWF